MIRKNDVIMGSESRSADISKDLYNTNSCAKPKPVQVPLDYTTPDGCHVKLTFRKKSKPGVREEIARLLLDAFEERVRKQ